jgi:hypothetical protein
MVSLALADDRQIQKQKQKHDQAQHSHTKSNNHYIKITECPTDPCAIYYTDAISQSILVVCQNPKHTDTAKGIEKQVGRLGSSHRRTATTSKSGYPCEQSNGGHSH